MSSPAFVPQRVVIHQESGGGDSGQIVFSPLWPWQTEPATPPSGGQPRLRESTSSAGPPAPRTPPVTNAESPGPARQHDAAVGHALASDAAVQARAAVFAETPITEFRPTVPSGNGAQPLVGDADPSNATADPAWALAGLLALAMLGPPDLPRRQAQGR
jgi:hypothetical protein